MPESPFAITEKEDITKLASQIETLFGDIYQERLGGAEIGDVFTVGDGDVLSLQIASAGGLEKSGGALAAKIKASSGLTVDSDGLQVGVRANYGIDMDANGLALIKQAHEADASTAHAVNDWATTNAALDALGTKINNILAKLETLKAFASS